MLGTLDREKKADWKNHISPLVHAYNSTRHESTGHSPFFLMFGRHPRLPVDVALGTDCQQDKTSLSSYVSGLRKRLSESYKLASDNIETSQQDQKKKFDEKVRGATVHVGDRVLVRKLAFDGKHKLADKWEEEVYIVQSQPNSDIPVFVLKREDGQGRSRTLHRNLLLPISSLPLPPDHLHADQHRRKLPDIQTPKTRQRRMLPKTPERKPQPAISEDGASSSEDNSLVDEDFAVLVVGPLAKEPPVVSEPDIAVPDAGEDTGLKGVIQPDNEIRVGLQEEPEEEPADMETSPLDQDEQDSAPESEGSNDEQHGVKSDDSVQESQNVIHDRPIPLPRRSHRERRPPARFRSGEFSMFQTTNTHGSGWREKVVFLRSLVESCFFFNLSLEDRKIVIDIFMDASNK
jgi:hypothetical protein